MTLPITSPYPPMEAQLVSQIPHGEDWQYEPKWDGFRCLVFRDGSSIELQSKAGQPLGRYFPDVVQTVASLKPDRFVLDGEIVIPTNGRLSFDDRFEELMDNVEHHIEEEETELFPKAQALGKELDELGQQIEQEKEAVRA